jgi:hypothetical protein
MYLKLFYKIHVTLVNKFYLKSMKNYKKILLALSFIIPISTASARTIEVITNPGCVTNKSKADEISSRYSSKVSKLDVNITNDSHKKAMEGKVKIVEAKGVLLSSAEVQEIIDSLGSNCTIKNVKN